LFGPDIQSDIAIAQRHGIIFIGTQGIPGHVIGRRERIITGERDESETGQEQNNECVFHWDLKWAVNLVDKMRDHGF
jgi:hypothetical protein